MKKAINKGETEQCLLTLAKKKFSFNPTFFSVDCFFLFQGHCQAYEYGSEECGHSHQHLEVYPDNASHRQSGASNNIVLAVPRILFLVALIKVL